MRHNMFNTTAIYSPTIHPQKIVSNLSLREKRRLIKQKLNLLEDFGVPNPKKFEADFLECKSAIKIDMLYEHILNEHLSNWKDASDFAVKGGGN